jgi:hypothetical protein|nr:MAG: hypothetical protein [Bacteriophage sp.]UWI11200.1 MAG: hypothetical protein [Bacteriophage sp.]DAQ21885.1 MAG TPA: RlmM ferredoxin-like domain [Caudoviricetes sp.]
MDKVLGQEYEGKARIDFLRDNCDAVEDLGYTKQLPNEEIEALKDRLVENNIQLRDVRADKKAANKEFNDQIKQLEESNDEVTGKLKAKSEFVTEACFKFVDTETREVGYYNREGLLVYCRPGRPEEMQKSMFSPVLRTGTEG